MELTLAMSSHCPFRALKSAKSATSVTLYIGRHLAETGIYCRLVAVFRDDAVASWCTGTTGCQDSPVLRLVTNRWWECAHQREQIECGTSPATSFSDRHVGLHGGGMVVCGTEKMEPSIVWRHGHLTRAPLHDCNAVKTDVTSNWCSHALYCTK
jgi:hypothetical protein